MLVARQGAGLAFAAWDGAVAGVCKGYSAMVWYAPLGKTAREKGEVMLRHGDGHGNGATSGRGGPDLARRGSPVRP